MRILALSTLILPLLLVACSQSEEPSTEEVAKPAQNSPELVESAAAKPADTSAVETVPVEAPAKAAEAAPAVEQAESAAPEQPKPKIADASSVNIAPGTAPAFVKGKHYEELAAPVKTITGSKIEVAEVFSYGCIHCYRFEGAAKAWKASMPEGVEFVQTHAVFNPSWAYYAKIFYTAKSLGVLDQVHLVVFKTIHEGRNRLSDKKQVAAIFKDAGVEEDIFNETFDSFGVNSQVQMADSRVRGFQTRATPELVVDGRYRVTTEMAGNYTNMFSVVNFLVEKIKKEKQ
ncbi:thiol:disulfide interchange protein DsbA [Alteromonadaceae bacterium Bs31]|nr:thiol:disulfide interchange protein DsbA [Alteromonadaceae bacterium Bs31]